MIPTPVESILVSVPPVVEFSAMSFAVEWIKGKCGAEDISGLISLIRELVPKQCYDWKKRNPISDNLPVWVDIQR